MDFERIFRENCLFRVFLGRNLVFLFEDCDRSLASDLDLMVAMTNRALPFLAELFEPHISNLAQRS